VMQCPECGAAGRKVSRRTVVSHVLPTHLQAVETTKGWLSCRTASCGVGYFASAKVPPIRLDSMLTTPFPKSDAPERLVCFCFGHTVAAVTEDARSHPESTIKATIAEACRASQDDCERLNPEGHCCLGNVAAVIRDANPEPTSPEASCASEREDSCCPSEPGSSPPGDSVKPGNSGLAAALGTVGAAALSSVLLTACGGGQETALPEAGEAADFTVGGVISDLEGEPVIDVFVTVSTEFCIPDRTNEDGSFEVQEVVAGPKRLITYGETASSSLVASVSFAFEAQAAHVFGAPIQLPLLDETWPLDEEALDEQVITTSAGLTLTIAVGALDLAPFAPSELQVARVPLAATPDFVPEGVELVDLFVLHPILSTLDPPASIAFPNDTGLSPGTRVRFYTLDYEAGLLTTVATGLVDEQGRATTDAGQGIPELTWVGLSLEEEG